MSNKESATRAGGRQGEGDGQDSEVVETVLVTQLAIEEDLHGIQNILRQDLQTRPGVPNERQIRLLAELTRLHHSLRAPDALLDKGNYSRPFPPRDRQNR